ncbi:MAG: polymer-forming cytoskeletal protein [Halobacteriales archaeon]|nr:polymer-forming cytoskeletal protein [Halobacteriales archaeon]
MSLRQDPLDELVIPDGATVEEHDLVTAGDVLVGGQSTVEFGVRGRNVLGGERVTFGGGIEAEGDCRLDMWSEVDGTVLVGEDAYLGARVHVKGQLVVGGDLDIGDDVTIDQGFEANGWIVIRNPMPTIVFLLIYLSQLLRIGEEEAAETLVSELFDDEAAEQEPLVIPRGSQVGDDAWRVSTAARVGSGCRLHGNIRAASIDLGSDTELFGSLRARGDIAVGERSVIHGDVSTRSGEVRLGADVNVKGDVACDDAVIHQSADVDGSIRARGELRLVEELAGPEIDEEAETETEIGAADGAAGGEVDADEDAEVAEESAEADAPEPEEHVCAECGRGFASQQGLAGHSRVHK